MRFRIVFRLAVMAMTASCATAGATYKSGVAPKSFDKPPFYTGAVVTADTRAAHLPIRYQRGAEQPANHEPRDAAGSPAANLVAEMNAFLDSLSLSAKVSPKSAEVGTAPDVHFGCDPALIGDCLGENEENANRRLQLSVGRPSQEWIGWFGSTLESEGHDRAIMISLEVGQYWPRQKGLSFGKEIRLGTDYTVSIPWLTALDKPVEVVQLTGALVGRDGRAIRIGAEGMLAKRTRLVVGMFGAQEIVTDEDVQQLRTLRREDLPGQPLVWQVALRNLVEQLTGRGDQTGR